VLFIGSMLAPGSHPETDLVSCGRTMPTAVEDGSQDRFRSLVTALAGDESVDLDSAQDAAPSLPADAVSADDAEDATADLQVAVPLPVIPVEPFPAPVRPGLTPGRAVSPSDSEAPLDLDGSAEVPDARATIDLDRRVMSPEHLGNTD
jgi:hypothetical protein